MNLLVKKHSANSKDYRNILKKINYNFNNKKIELFHFYLSEYLKKLI